MTHGQQFQEFEKTGLQVHNSKKYVFLNMIRKTWWQFKNLRTFDFFMG